MEDEAFVSGFLSAKYDRISTKQCESDEDCGAGKWCGKAESAHNPNERSTKNMCFDSEFYVLLKLSNLH